MFISFEGIDGCGKSTISKNVYNHFKKTRNCLWTREPGGTKLGDSIRKLLLDSDYVEEKSEILLFAASRSQHVKEVIEPALKNNIMVFVDRFIDSSLVYQGIVRINDLDKVHEINHFAINGIYPDLCVIIDLNIEEAQKRTKIKVRDRIEKENIIFHNEVRKGFLKLPFLFSERKYLIIDGEKSVEEISQICIKKINSIFKEDRL